MEEKKQEKQNTKEKAEGIIRGRIISFVKKYPEMNSYEKCINKKREFKEKAKRCTEINNELLAMKKKENDDKEQQKKCDKLQKEYDKLLNELTSNKELIISLETLTRVVRQESRSFVLIRYTEIFSLFQTLYLQVQGEVPKHLKAIEMDTKQQSLIGSEPGR